MELPVRWVDVLKSLRSSASDVDAEWMKRHRKTDTIKHLSSCPKQEEVHLNVYQGINMLHTVHMNYANANHRIQPIRCCLFTFSDF